MNEDSLNPEAQLGNKVKRYLDERIDEHIKIVCETVQEVMEKELRMDKNLEKAKIVICEMLVEVLEDMDKKDDPFILEMTEKLKKKVDEAYKDAVKNLIFED